MNFQDLLNYLDFREATKKPLEYTYANVNNDFKKLKQSSFTICTAPKELSVVIDGNTETTRTVAIGDFVIRGPKGDLYSTTAERFLSSYSMTASAKVIPIKKKIAIVSKALFKKLNLPIPYSYTGPFGAPINVYPGDGIIADPATKTLEYFRIDPKVMRATYNLKG